MVVAPTAVPLLALVSAMCSASSAIFIRQGLRSGDGSYTGFWVNLCVGTVCLWAGVLLVGGLDRLSVAGIAFFAVAGLVGTVAGRLLRFLSIETVGASISAAMLNVTPLVASALAIVLLGEHVTLPIVAGTIVIATGTTLLSSGGRTVGLRPGQLILPLMSATCFGVGQVIRKVGLSDMGPVAGFAVNVTTALIAFTAFLVASGQREAMVCRGRSLVYFVAAGLAENIGVFLTIVALSVGTVSVVVPLTSVAPIFVLLLSFFFLRGIEVLNRRVVLGTLLTVVGVYLLVG